MTRTSPQAHARYIDPHVLASIGNLQIVARAVVDGFINGLHRAPHLGLSLDFAEHRPYMPGDDIRRVDWRLYARTDRYHVKQYEADTNANFMVMVDVSKSMGYGSGSITKLDYARFLAASLAYFSSLQRDRVGLITFAKEILEYVPNSARHLDTLLHTVASTQPRGASDYAAVLLKAQDLLRRRGIIVIVSDLYDDPAAIAAALAPLSLRGHDVIVFHVLDPAEHVLPFDAATSIEDLESGERLPVVPAALRDRYHELMREHIEALNRKLSDQRIDYIGLRTDEPLDRVLFEYLSARERRSRTR
ncbi:MAG: DUF58 domain-containing protein [Longimicrobiales bacterium]